MSEIIGREIEVGLATEATRGTAESTADKWLKNVTATVYEKVEKAEDDATRGRFEDMDGTRVVSKYIEGDIEGIVHVDALGYLLANVYGNVSSAVVAGSVYDHTFTLKQSPEHIALSVFAKDGGVQQLVYSNCMVNALEMSIAIDDYIRFTASFMGSSATDNSDTPSYDTEYDFVARDVTVKFAATEVALTGATAIKIKEATLTWDQAVIRNQVVGAYTPDDNYNAKLALEGSFTLDFTDETYKDLMLDDTAKYMQIVIAGEAILGGTYVPTITLLCNKVIVTNWDREGGNDDLVTQTVEFKCYYNPTDTQASSIVLRNLTASYANVPSN